MEMTSSDPRSRASYKRNVTITVIVLIALIILGVVIGALSMKIGGPIVELPEEGLREMYFAAAYAVGALA